MSRRTGLFDLENHFAFYGAYHNNPINVLIHILFVWPIFLTALVLFYFTPSILDPSRFGFLQSLTFDGVLRFNFGFLFASVYALFYFAMDKKAGSLAAVMCFACWVGSSFIGARLGYSLAWKVVLASQLFCWIGQFIGHGLFEKRAPALLDNLVQAFLMAPFFVLLEILQSVFGYEPYPGFEAAVKGKIANDLREWREKKQKKKIT
ncbi:PREDICTED: uncharacterized endoplasmic reticulum membrane protein YGL010W [Tarenaya hassleriana]|uniref:uncharacterized endoplasmic reticulum membrane protein YGL010W n=1 Tax=Tarenaya hassleriana TaxID=28532 RepID=UPI00053C978D|nr:PREDICTED: uncharacterized endoplasmic reticulum membrane protein YGL010W [Tarenaya hassleriana]